MDVAKPWSLQALELSSLGAFEPSRFRALDLFNSRAFEPRI